MQYPVRVLETYRKRALSVNPPATIDSRKLLGRVLLAAGALVLMFGAVSCGDSADEPILVFAAASLTDPLTELSERFEDETGIKSDLNFAGSNALARQIVAGAPADLFLSAGASPVELLLEEGLAAESDIRELLGNELVVVTGSDAGSVNSLGSLLDDSVTRVAIVDPGLGPAGRYAEQALRSDGAWDALLPKTVLASDVRAILSYVEAGNADAGIVYRTDAATVPELRVAFVVPSELHSPIQYLGVVPGEADGSEAASRMLEFLTSEAASNEFGRFGFLAAPSRAR